MTRAMLLSAVVVACIASTTEATPLRMDYTITDLGSTYQYNFTLTLDDNDASWVAGQQWDWIIFGDNDFFDTKNGFDPNGGDFFGTDWTTLGFSEPISEISTTGGGHNGPTLVIGGSPLLPGWEPADVGDFLSWYGISGILIPDGELFWSSARTSAPVLPNFVLANEVTAPVTSPVPEPASLILLGTGLVIVALRRTR